jgi:CxxC motif-containing protein (DUF1111 family)
MILAACEEFQPKAPDDNELLDGPASGLTETENLQFLRGDVAFNDEIFTSAKGLGPLFVATSCGSCHPGDGKGHPFTSLTRFGQTDENGNQYLHTGGPQLQHRAIPGFTPEAIPQQAKFSRFTPPANTGLGFIDAVSDSEILAWADSTDSDGDGISGVPNWVTLKQYVKERPNGVTHKGKNVGRFGKKASVYDLLEQTATAYNQDIGITSSFEPIDTHSGLVLDAEISDQTVNDVVFYLKTLKAPIPRPGGNSLLEGKQLFINVGCSTCHRPEMKTNNSPIAALANKVFYPYSDFLLHDMGPALDDGYTEGTAKTYEWRTPPLWGLGLSKDSQGGQYFLMHDGRAGGIDEAILMHGGEADQIRNNYQGLRADEKIKLIQFLESL